MLRSSSARRTAVTRPTRNTICRICRVSRVRGCLPRCRRRLSGNCRSFYRLRGPGLALCVGRASGLVALAEAETLLQTGQAAACVVLAVEVSGPALSPVQLSDAAVALWLTADRDGIDPALPRLVSAAESFIPDDPTTALARALASQPGGAVCCDGETARFGGGCAR